MLCHLVASRRGLLNLSSQAVCSGERNLQGYFYQLANSSNISNSNLIYSEVTYLVSINHRVITCHGI